LANFYGEELFLEGVVMECPVCGSTAVVADTCIDNYVEQAQEGVDFYDVICADGAMAACKACGNKFVPAEGE
jgi:hypothetical protein